MSIGADLLAVPFPQMVVSLAMAIADGQKRLDKASISTLKELARTKFDFIESITEVLEPVPQTVTTRDGHTVNVTGVQVDTTISPPTQLTLLQAGLAPTFYQFTESVIDVKIALKSSTDTSFDVNVSFDFSAEGSSSFDDGAGGNYSGSSTWASHVDASYSSKYSYSAEGSSSLTTTLKPIPPPNRVMPRFISVNAFFSPPQVTIDQ